MKNKYEINSTTCAIIPLDVNTSQIIEHDDTFLVTQNSLNIIDESCKYFGSSYEGRKVGTKALTGINYKTPIIIEETKSIIFFPTSSPRLNLSTWININYVEEYKKNKEFSNILLKNGQVIELNLSIGSLENQILRATRLESILRKRKNIEN
ncbi:MAG: competence protein ComK [Mycoplasmatota bacterium]